MVKFRTKKKINIAHPFLPCLLAPQSDLCTVSGNYKWTQQGGRRGRATAELLSHCHQREGPVTALCGEGDNCSESQFLTPTYKTYLDTIIPDTTT